MARWVKLSSRSQVLFGSELAFRTEGQYVSFGSEADIGRVAANVCLGPDADSRVRSSWVAFP